MIQAPSVSGKIRTLNLRIISWVIYSCATWAPSLVNYLGVFLDWMKRWKKLDFLEWKVQIERQDVESVAADPAKLEFQKTLFYDFLTFYLPGHSNSCSIQKLTLEWRGECSTTVLSPIVRIYKKYLFSSS